MSVHIERSFVRSTVECLARVQPENAAAFMALVVDLSQGGCRLQTDKLLASGAHVALRLPDLGERRARVIWRIDHNAGCAFDRLVEVADVHHAVAASRL